MENTKEKPWIDSVKDDVFFVNVDESDTDIIIDIESVENKEKIKEKNNNG